MDHQSKSLLVTKDRVRSMLVDYFDDHERLAKESEECWRVFYEKYHAKNYIMIRPSGNQIDAEGFIKYITSGKLEICKCTLVCVESIQILAGGTAAVATYTADQIFRFQGKMEEDRAKVTCVIEQVDGQLKIAHEHRTPGQPIPKVSRWDDSSKSSHLDNISSRHSSHGPGSAPSRVDD